ncbi:MAG: site-specific integrase [Planctomycetaceae bacterium]|nr:site-specific integrase [Planctomycetaceae bacterium]
MLKAVHRFLITDKHLPESLRFHFPLRRPPGSDTYCNSSEQVRRTLKHGQLDRELHWLFRVILTLVLTGFRIGELISLRRSDIHRDDDGTPAFLRVVDEGSRARRDESLSRRRTKSRRSRQVPIHSELQPLLDALPIRTDGVLFLTDKGRPVTYDVILSTFVERVIKPLSSAFPTVVGQIGFENGRLHSFRPYFVSQSLLNGASEGEIRDWIGHADTGLIDLYRHLTADESRRRMRHLNLLGARPGTDGPSRAPTDRLGPHHGGRGCRRANVPMDEV